MNSTPMAPMVRVAGEPIGELWSRGMLAVSLWLQ
jgi:hypothetical protein